MINPSCNDSVIKVNSETGLITDTTELASVFNKFLIQMAESLKNRYINLHKALQLLEKTNVDEIIEMKSTPVTEIEEKNTITPSKEKNASGYEGISSKNLKTLCKFHKQAFYSYIQFFTNFWNLSRQV